MRYFGNNFDTLLNAFHCHVSIKNLQMLSARYWGRGWPAFVPHLKQPSDDNPQMKIALGGLENLLWTCCSNTMEPKTENCTEKAAGETGRAEMTGVG